MVTQYRISHKVKVANLGDVMSRLRDRLQLIPGNLEKLEIALLDSFDWRIFQSGAVLESVTRDGGAELGWRELHSLSYDCKVCLDCEIDFAWNLPAGPVRDRLRPVLKKRILLPKTRLRVKRHHFKQLNRDEKIVLKLCVEEYQIYLASSGKFQYLESRVQITPVMGYGKSLTRAVKKLSAMEELEPVQGDIQLSALSRLGIDPHQSGSRKIDLSVTAFSPNLRSDQAVKTLLQHLLKTMQVNEPGVREDLDSEFLHDYRIAVRQTRSVLKQINQIFPQREQQRWAKGFAWLGDLTSPVRDLDVYLLNMLEYETLLPPGSNAHLEPLRHILQQKKQTAHSLLVARLAQHRYQNFLAAYAGFLEKEIPRRSVLKNSCRPIIEVANERIWRLYRRLLRDGGAITDDSTAQLLHALRKTGKELRYLMELFIYLYPTTPIRVLIGELKIVQNNLGDFNDLEVQALMLRGLKTELHAEGELPTGVADCVDQLIALVLEKQRKKRFAFADCFKRFSSDTNHTLFQKLFKADPNSR